MGALRRQVEVFTGGSPQCAATVTRVEAVARHCDIIIHDVTSDARAAQRAKELLIVRLPTVVDGVKLPGDVLGNVSEAVLRDASVD
jgi:hypothetical protein